MRAILETEQKVRDGYERAAGQVQDELNGLNTRWRNIGYLRGGSFLLALVPLLGAVIDFGELGNVWWWLFAGAVALFVGIAGFHETIADRIRRQRLVLKMQQASLARFDRRLADLTDPIPDPPAEYQAVSRDLDLFGAHSLYRLLGTTRTPMGIELLTNWLLVPSDAREVGERQQAVAALKNQHDWRQRFSLLCERLAASQRGPSHFVAWCQSADWFSKRGWVLWLSRVACVLIFASLLLMLPGWLPLQVGLPLLLAAALANFFLSVAFAGSIHDEFNQISSRHEETACYQTLFGEIKNCPGTSPRLEALRSRLFGTGDIARGMGSLGRLVWWANLRRNGVFFLFYIVLQLIFFWDVHVLSWLEKWKQRFGGHARQWFLDLGQWETLVALSKFAADHPEWVFPKVFDKGMQPQVIEAQQLGHPLLPQVQRVDNDVKLGPDGTFLLVTGSNMSGKSTLLRSIGLNVTLAQLGTVVCARSMSLPCLVIDTSMRISDSLAAGVSFFMAELQRLKQIVDHSRTRQEDAQRGHLFLLDEILQGTNSRERQIAVAQVVRQLVDQHSIGAISTHDLELADVGSLAKICDVVHFTESFEERDGKETMIFDYQMHHGVAPTTNALKLLELVGLGQVKSD